MAKKIRFYFLLRLSFLTFLTFLLSCSGPPKPDRLPEISETEPASLAELEKALESENAQAKSLAILELADRNERNYLPKIRSFLTGNEKPLRGPAALALGIYKDRSSKQGILNLLQPGSGVGIDTVLEALARMGDADVGNKLVPFLESEDSTIRLLTVDTLVRIDARSVSGNLLASAQKNSDPEKTKTYAMAIGKLRIQAGEAYLLKQSENLRPSPSLAAVYLALGKIKSRKAVPLLIQAMTAEFDKGRENSSIALVDIGDPSSIPAVLPLIGHPSREIRYRAADVLIGIPSQQTGPNVLRVLRTGSADTKGPASHILGRIKYAPARESIETSLLDTSLPDREIIAQSLGYLGDKRSIPVLSGISQETSGEARYGAVWALGGIGAPEALPLLEKAADSSDQKLARIAAESLGMIASPKSLALLDRKTQQFPDLAPSTLGAIASIKGEEAESILEKYARSQNWNLHQVAVAQLGARKDPKSLPVLIFLLEDNETPRNRKLVVAALKSVTGEKFSSKNEWLNWYQSRK
ncbi:HEAT repeat domain-containing protein [Leptospira fletcheri]|uniref:HEAT repeat domain-containing protein n=1 Tax=Leptospira fletcheri TaxID=2484981 RepID=A0A4R9GG11_9LEPT|nr:HEAT repeat domain-containing protein [Leptospira fletcheri]